MNQGSLSGSGGILRETLREVEEVMGRRSCVPDTRETGAVRVPDQAHSIENDIDRQEEKSQMSKRILVAGSVVLLLGLVFGTSAFASGGAEKPTTLAISIRTLSNPYQNNYKVGAEAYGKSAGLPVDILTTEANSQKGLTDIKAEVAKTGGNVVFFIDPNQETDDVAIAQILDQAGVYFVTWWNKPADVKVWNYKHWVAHVSFDGVAAGYFTAQELFKTFKTPNKGKVFAIQGLLANTPAAERFQGLQKALKENPGVELVQWVAGDWDRTKAYNLTREMLIAHPDIDGVWCANDDMAMGSIQALKEANLAGKVMVTGTDGIPELFDAIKAGTAAATVMNDAKYQSGLGLAMSLAAKKGKLNVAAQPQKYRQFEIPAVNVNKANVDQIVHDYIDNTDRKSVV
jgi:ribose transport system substrate-binding protein